MGDFQDGAFGDDEIVGNGEFMEERGDSSRNPTTDEIAVDGAFGDFFRKEDAEAGEFGVYWMDSCPRLHRYAKHCGQVRRNDKI